MKKIFAKKLISYMVLALLVTMTFIFFLQTFVAQSNNTASSVEKLNQVKEKLMSNDAEIEKLTQNLGENNLAKARAFADILAVDETVLSSSARLNEICEKLMVNELHIIDKKGIITHSTIEAYIGFDMNSGEQSAAFMVIVDDPSIEIVQEPQKNAAEGTVIQYIGVTRKDEPGVVQVGIRPEILSETLANTEIDVVLRDIEFGDHGYVYAIDAATGAILAHPNTALIGTMAADAGFKVDAEGGKGKIKVDGVTGYYVAEVYDNMLIGTFLPSNEYYTTRTSQTIVVSISMFIIFLALLLVINRTVDSKIVTGINHIGDSMKKIADGDFGVVVSENGNPEFTQLSENINKMVAGIRKNMQENEELLVQQKADMETNLAMIQNIKTACSDLNSVSRETLTSADGIYNGTEEQKKAVDELEKVMSELVTGLNASAGESTKVTETTETAVNTILQTQAQMKELSNSIEHISDMSREIEKIIDEINAIAGQTNLLALNASIEAARAGEMGRGFSVVATEVGNLAARSSQAAMETNELINNSIRAIGEGKEITERTVLAFNLVVENIGQANQGVEEIADMVRGNVTVVEQAVAEIDRIANVVEHNVEISQNSRQISANMAEITGQLTDIVNGN